MGNAGMCQRSCGDRGKPEGSDKPFDDSYNPDIMNLAQFVLFEPKADVCHICSYGHLWSQVTDPNDQAMLMAKYM